jgi:RNA recognition motif-containing protein
MRIYVGNLPPSINDVKLNELALAYGKPDSANIARLLAGGMSKGFGYIDYVNPDEAYAAIAGLDGKKVDGQFLTAREANPSPARSRTPARQTRARG